jgi:hypothetical protein
MILGELLQIFVLYLFKNKIIFIPVIFVATKKIEQQIFSHLLFCCCCWIQDPVWIKIKIRDKHPGSAILLKTVKILHFLRIKYLVPDTELDMDT